MRNELIVSAHNTEICNNSRIRLSEVLSIEHIIKYAPTVEERPRGEWIYKLDVDWIDGERTHYFTCPFCSKIYINKKHKFCSECGADMRGEGE